MTRIEENLYLQSVFDAIDEVYKMKKHPTYEERLRASFNKLLVPDWYNHDYTTINGLRKAKSHGQVPRVKRHNNNNNITPNTSVSTSTNGRHRSSSQSWSERPPLRCNSSTSSYDTNGDVIINDRCSTTNSNGTSTYAPGLQRVAQSSTWYKPKRFITKITNGNNNGHSINPPKPLPRYSKLDYERINSSSSSSSLPTNNHTENVRQLLKPRTMAQIPTEEINEEFLLNVSLDLSSDGDITVVQKPSSSWLNDVSSFNIDTTITNDRSNQSMATHIPRTNSMKSVSSDVESYRSAILPSSDKNLLGTDSSSYASVNDPYLTASTSSYHTAIAGDTSSATGYETPTPQLDGTLSSHSSISDLSHAETLEPNIEDLDIVTVSTGEQKPAIISPVDVGMEKLPLPPFSSTIFNTSSSSSSSVGDSSPSIESRPIENTNWYDNGSIETCIHQTALQLPSAELREISTDEILHEVDMNGVGDEFILFSPRNTTDDDPSSSISDDKHEQDFEQISKRIYTMENKTSHTNDDFTLSDDFHCSSTVDPFGYNHNNSSLMITNLDDLLMDDDEHSKDSYLLNTNYRRPIQEDILYEVEHENSYSDHSQNTSSLIIADDNTSIKLDPNSDFFTSINEPIKTDLQQSSPEEIKSFSSLINENNTLPIYILPPLYTPKNPLTIEKPSSLHIDTYDNSSYMYNLNKWDSFNHQYADLSNSSGSLSYTSKIRNRHYSVGSYYDNKTTTVALHPNHTLYLIGSAPVSPLSRTSTTESHYHLHHHSPVTYANITSNALRRVNPFLDTNYDYQRSSSLDRNRTVEQPTPIIQTEPTPVVSPSIYSPTFPQYDLPKANQENSTSPPRKLEQEPPLVRPKTSRGRARTPPPPPPPRTTSFEKDQTQHIYQEIDASLTDEDPTATRNADLQFIRGTIERVFDFHGESTSDSSTFYEEISEDNKSVSLSTSSKKMNQQPSVEAVQRFYTNTKISSESIEKKNVKEQTTNLDEMTTSNNSSTSNKLYARSHPANARKKVSKSSDTEQASSEEVDDTLNDIEEDDYQDEKLKRQATTNSSHTSNENSPVHSSQKQSNIKKTSQETQTLQQHKPIIVTTQSPSGSQSTIQSYETAHSTMPPIDIITQMVIERADGDDGEIGEISGDMIIFYDDIEIVEHSSNISSTESDSTSSNTRSRQSSRPIQTIIESLPPPPIPARTLKPSHLLNNQQQQQPRHEPIISPSSQTNRIYELEKSTIRKKFDVNSVNDIINRTDYYIGPTASHRHPSARHFVGKLNSDDSASHNSSLKSTKTSSMVKSQTLPIKSLITNGHSTNNVPTTPTKNPFSTLPTRSASSVGTNGKHRSIIADTNALVKQLQNSLSRNSLHDSQVNPPLSISTKDLRTFVSSTYSPSDENVIDDDGIIHIRQQNATNYDDQSFTKQARLSKSFHNVSEYNSIDQYPKKENKFTSKTQPSKSVENNLNRVSRQSHIPLNFPPVVASTSFSALPHSEDNARMLSMKWYTGQVSENSEICYSTPHNDNDDLLYGYISAHSNRETQSLLARLQASNDIRIHAALDDIRLRVAQFDASKSPDDLHVFMRYLESRLRDISNKKTSTANLINGQRRISNGGTTNGHHVQQQQQQQQPDTISIKSRTSSIINGVSKETLPFRQLGRQHLRSSGNIAGGETNGYQPPPPPRRASQSSVNQENPAVFDDMLNTVLGLPRSGVSTLPPAYPSPSHSRDKSTPLTQTQMTTNMTTPKKIGGVGKRLFESGTYKDPRLIYDGPKRNEKEEQPLETSV